MLGISVNYSDFNYIERMQNALFNFSSADANTKMPIFFSFEFLFDFSFSIEIEWNSWFLFHKTIHSTCLMWITCNGINVCNFNGYKRHGLREIRYDPGKEANLEAEHRNRCTSNKCMGNIGRALWTGGTTPKDKEQRIAALEMILEVMSLSNGS